MGARHGPECGLLFADVRRRHRREGLLSRHERRLPVWPGLQPVQEDGIIVVARTRFDLDAVAAVMLRAIAEACVGRHVPPAMGFSSVLASRVHVEMKVWRLAEREEHGQTRLCCKQTTHEFSILR